MLSYAQSLYELDAQKRLKPLSASNWASATGLIRLYGKLSVSDSNRQRKQRELDERLTTRTAAGLRISTAPSWVSQNYLKPT